MTPFDHKSLCSMLILPFRDQEAYKNSFIDEHGNESKVPEENSCYTPIHQLIYGIKKMILNSPNGGKLLQQTGLALNKLSSLQVTHNPREHAPFLESFQKSLDFILDNDLHCLYEETVIEEFVKSLEEDEGAAPTTTTSNVDGVTLPLGKKIIKRKEACQESQD